MFLKNLMFFFSPKENKQAKMQIKHPLRNKKSADNNKIEFLIDLQTLIKAMGIC